MNSTTHAGNGAPDQGIAVFGVSQNSDSEYPWVFWPGSPGIGQFCDDEDNRQTLVDTRIAAAC